MSLGLHSLWKKKMLAELTNLNGTLLDVAGGTGDISTLYYNKAKSHNRTPTIILTDINLAMLNIARDKLINNNILAGINLICSDAEKLPFPSMHFDYYTIAFGIRNVTHIEAALAEAYRVLKPGGKFICLEFSQVDNPALAKLYDFYSFKVIPQMGKCIADNEDAYRYLAESIRKFPNQENFAAMIRKAGFTQVKYQNLTFGVTAIHTGYRI
jgi:ubiquinone/menaquinone biosynthesis methyltransferase